MLVYVVLGQPAAPYATVMYDYSQILTLKRFSQSASSEGQLLSHSGLHCPHTGTQVHLIFQEKSKILILSMEYLQIWHIIQILFTFKFLKYAEKKNNF